MGMSTLLERCPECHQILPDQEEVYRDDYLELNRRAHTLKVMGFPVHITVTEWNILDALVTHAGKSLSSQALLAVIYREPELWADCNLKWHVSNLRRNLSRVSEAPIHTVRSWGYLYEPPV
jgi:DNA-binding response OmpR family regulator